eukprot:Nitzschia sp. Nitz4//scaffold306_size21755//9910//13748//NITZ4_008590-RA/size21755-snap-gene-0.13-mRNA-1//1//CDS//3329547114//158//frame0
MATQKSNLKKDVSSRDAEGAVISPRNHVRMAPGNPRERIESTLDKWHDDDLSIVASEEDDNSADGHSLAASGTGGSTRAAKTAPVDLVRRETKIVSTLRVIVVLLILAIAVFLCFSTFRWLEKAEKFDFYNEEGDLLTCAWDDSIVLQSYAQALESNLKHHQQAMNVAAFSLSASFTSFAIETDTEGTLLSTWPFVTIPHLEPRLTGVLGSLGTVQVRLAPRVTADYRTTFEHWAVDEQIEECSTCDYVESVYNDDGSTLTNSATTFPVWQVAPYTSEPNLLMNLLANDEDAAAIQALQSLGASVLTDFIDETSFQESPNLALYYPVFAEFQQVNLATVIDIEFSLLDVLNTSLPFDLGARDEYTIFMQSCSGRIISYATTNDGTSISYTGSISTLPSDIEDAAVSFQMNGAFLYGDFVNPVTSDDVCNFDVYVVSSEVADNVLGGAFSNPLDEFDSNRHVVMTIVVAALFFLLILVFAFYDRMVQKRQEIVVNIATKSSAIVENLFPAQVRDRMLQNMQDKDPAAAAGAEPAPTNGVESAAVKEGDNVSKNVIPTPNGAPSQVSVKQFLSNEPGNMHDLSSKPIADLFPNTTVLFADIAGFTAWSSTREPPEVFMLLETLYRSFDVIAKKLKVFKVETIGDCYMAVTGLPNPDDAHAVHMARFAYQCLVGMKELIRELVSALGPGTSELALRVGLHSGPVTAGVLRGEKSRFQLFGDTVNTASRMESTGTRGKIQVSQDTADLLMGAGKSHWLKPRDEAVIAKGKGEMKTYWLDPTKKRRTTKSHKDIRVAQEISLNNHNTNGGYVDKPLSKGDEATIDDDKYARLIDWNVDVLLHHLARVISHRSRSPSRGSLVNHSSEVALLPAAINDVAEVVALPPFDAEAARFRKARPDVTMLQQTRADLHEYVKRIALAYNDVPFHNFEHASHVTLCANKLLNRLVNSDEYETEEALHNSTFGISSDPLTHFAIVFAALIHDVDHSGLPNAQLVKDKHPLAVKFDNKSVAEQNSVHLGWEMLMDPRFERLRKCIYQTNIERKRFRQLVINSVMATDIADRQVNEARHQKWVRAFAERESGGIPTALQMQEDMNKKSTAVIEHIIQVSDVAHTMQHWHIYRRWNERLFCEMYEAFKSGRVAVDPSTNWYVGEVGFFDYYLIPLAMKLEECGVFGEQGNEYISYVLKNKKEWERKGRQVVLDMVDLHKEHDEEEVDVSGSSFASEDYDSLEYDSPGDMSSDEEDDEDYEEGNSMDPAEAMMR